MGGYNGGEIASKLATITARDYIIQNFEKLLEREEEPEKEEILRDS